MFISLDRSCVSQPIAKPAVSGWHLYSYLGNVVVLFGQAFLLYIAALFLALTQRDCLKTSS
jgi:competence protein ComGF